MSNTAQDILIPDNGTLRVAFLYAGQGDATLFIIPDGQNFKYALMDTNNDKKNGGIDVKKLLNDLLSDNEELVFINTHPHSDHIIGLKEIHEEVGVDEVWHSGHKPGKNHDDAYNEMKEVIDDIGEENEFILFGTNDLNKLREHDKETEVEKKLGDIDFQVLSPAEFVFEDVDGEDAETRYNRIHESCAVVRFTYGEEPKHIMMTGDSDKTAWKEHITDYHKEVLGTDVLSGSHHGSRTFFKDSEEDEDVYEDHIEEMEPDHVVISAPKQEESKHDHPHDDAIEIYEEHTDKDNIYHLGKNRECVIVDITSDGDIEVKLDQELVNEYGFDNEDEDESKNNATKAFVGSRTSRIDDKPMG